MTLSKTPKISDRFELFEKLRAQGVQYPKEKFPYGHSPCHWFPPKVEEAFAGIIRNLAPASIYLELGCFVGWGSTRVALKQNNTLLAVCVDHWRIHPGPNMVAPRGQFQPNTKKPVDYMQGKGTALEHFLNNTWNYRERVAPFCQMITVPFLEKLHRMGLYPHMIFADAGHEYIGVKMQLETFRRLWPKSLIVVDDYTSSWPGVMQAVKEAQQKGMYPKERSEILAHRLAVLRSPEYGK